MADDFGGMVYGSELIYGVPLSTWQGWDAHTQELWLQDYNRTEEQATYYKDSPEAIAFDYVSTIDDITDTAKDYGQTAKDYGQTMYTEATEGLEKAVLYGAIGLGLILLLK